MRGCSQHALIDIWLTCACAGVFLVCCFFFPKKIHFGPVEGITGIILILGIVLASFKCAALAAATCNLLRCCLNCLTSCILQPTHGWAITGSLLSAHHRAADHRGRCNRALCCWTWLSASCTASVQLTPHCTPCRTRLPGPLATTHSGTLSSQP